MPFPMLPFIPELNDADQALLYKLRLERFAQVIADPQWYRIDVQDEVLILEALAPDWVDAAICNFHKLSVYAYLILGVQTISLYYSEEWIADYTEDKILPEAFDMVATLEKEQTQVQENGLEQAESQIEVTANQQASSEYISLDRLREMASDIGGGSQDFIVWMEQNSTLIPMRFFNETPMFQTKAIAKAAEAWHNSKFQDILSKHLGTQPSPSRSESVEPNGTANGTVNGTANGTVAGTEVRQKGKQIKYPTKFIPTNAGRDKYSKTIQELAEHLGNKWETVRQEIINQTDSGVIFLNRMSGFYTSRNEAYNALLEEATNYTPTQSDPAPAPAPAKAKQQKAKAA